MAPVCTLTRMKAAPVAAAMPSAERASLRSTLTPNGSATAEVTAAITRVIAATVYNEPHIGNLRTFLWSDLLRRSLAWRGYRVTQVMNITDVEDKIIRNAQAAGEDIRTYVQPYIVAFHQAVRALRIHPADAYPRATELIPEMTALVQRLHDRGHTYVADGSTYFRVSTMPDYGK